MAGALCGITPKYASEVEPYPIAVTRSRFPGMIHLGDVSKVHGWDIDPVNVVTFGSPCQDMSIAGKRAGIKNENVGDEETTRSGLFHEAARIIREMREATNGVYPAFAVWENVPGAFSSNKGEDFRCVLETLIQIVEPGAVMPTVPKDGWPYFDHYCGDGWSLAYRTFDAQYWGVPQRRRRIYLVLDLTGQRAGEILFKREGLRGYFETGGTEGQGTATDAPGGFGAGDRPISYTLKIRSGCEEGGKGPLIQENKSATLATNNDQYLFVPVILDDQGGQQISVREDGVSPTLRAEMHSHPPCIMIQSAAFKADQGVKARGIGWQEERSPTLTASNSGTQLAPTVCIAFTQNQRNEVRDLNGVAGALAAEPGMKQQTFIAQALPFDTTQITSPQNGNNPKWGDPCHPLAAQSHPPAVVLRMQSFGDYKQDEVASALKARDYKDCTDIVCGVDCRNMNEYPELYPTLQAKPNGGQSLNFSGIVRIRYIVRRLTPTECCRLQGFPDGWGEIDAKETMDPEENFFWLEVRQTFDRINGRPVKDYTSKQILDWYKKLHTDSAEYKMWGNGIALPNAIYVMRGIKDAIEKG